MSHSLPPAATCSSGARKVWVRHSVRRRSNSGSPGPAPGAAAAVAARRMRLHAGRMPCPRIQPQERRRQAGSACEPALAARRLPAASSSSSSATCTVLGLAELNMPRWKESCGRRAGAGWRCRRWGMLGASRAQAGRAPRAGTAALPEPNSIFELGLGWCDASERGYLCTPARLLYSHAPPRAP